LTNDSDNKGPHMVCSKQVSSGTELMKYLWNQ